jgi:hypothetical protein
MITSKLVLVTGLFLNFSACASTNNGGHVVGNPILSESVSTKMKTEDAPTCACASSKDPKVTAKCKCAIDSTTSTSTSTSTKAAPAAK